MRLLPVALAALGACTYTGRPLEGGDDATGDDTPPSPLYLDCADAQAQGETTDGVYRIDPDGTGAFDAYCDLTHDGGGWTLAMKIDGALPTFAFDSPLWDSPDPFNADAADHDTTEAKLASYARVAADYVMIETATGRVWINPGGQEPLYGHVTGSAEVAAPAGRPAWQALVPGSSLPQDCSLWVEGTNIGDDGYQARVGLVAYGEDHEAPLDCDNHFDGSIGVGLWTDDSCDGGSDLPIAAGNINDGCTMPVFAYVYVRDLTRY